MPTRAGADLEIRYSAGPLTARSPPDSHPREPHAQRSHFHRAVLNHSSSSCWPLDISDPLCGPARIGVWAGYFSGAGAPGLVGAEVAEPLLAALFCAPAIRVHHDPPAAQPWVACNPLSPPAEVAAGLHITAPSDGSTYVAVGERVLIEPL
jgi:hypothetical protein